MPVASSVLTRPENRLLLGCACRLQAAALQAEFARLLEAPLDWDYLRPRLGHNGLLALFSHHAQGFEAQLPPRMQQMLRAEFSQSLQRRLMMLAELSEIVAFLSAQNVRVLAYKGPILAHFAYGSVALRPFSDLDLLIDAGDKARVVTLLRERGYEPEDDAVLPAHLEAKRQLRDYEMTLRPTRGVGALDVHWAVAPPYDGFALDFETLWKRRVGSELLPLVPTFCREDLLLCLCAHGLKHRWNRLEWIGCVLAMIQNLDKPLDWAQIEASAAQLKCGRALHLGLRLALDLAESTGQNTAAIEAVWPRRTRRDVLADATVLRLSQQVWQTIFEQENPQDEEFVTVAALLFALRAREGWRARWKYFRDINRAFLVPGAEDSSPHHRVGLEPYFARARRLILRRLHRLIVLRRL